MICKCGADMRHQSQGVWFCSRGDKFAVVIGQQAQWFSAEGEPERYPPTMSQREFDELQGRPLENRDPRG